MTLNGNMYSTAGVCNITEQPRFLTFNSSPPEQNGRHCADDIFKHVFLNENDPISLKIVPRGPIDNKSALVRVMAWHRTGDKPLSEPMLIHFIDAYMRH